MQNIKSSFGISGSILVVFLLFTIKISWFVGASVGSFSSKTSSSYWPVKKPPSCFLSGRNTVNFWTWWSRFKSYNGVVRSPWLDPLLVDPTPDSLLASEQTFIFSACFKQLRLGDITAVTSVSLQWCHCWNICLTRQVVDKVFPAALNYFSVVTRRSLPTNSGSCTCLVLKWPREPWEELKDHSRYSIGSYCWQISHQPWFFFPLNRFGNKLLAPISKRNEDGFNVFNRLTRSLWLHTGVLMFCTSHLVPTYL